jgi:hypothetical protein
MSFALPLSPRIGQVDKNVHSPYFAHHFSYIRSLAGHIVAGVPVTKKPRRSGSSARLSAGTKPRLSQRFGAFFYSACRVAAGWLRGWRWPAPGLLPSNSAKDSIYANHQSPSVRLR